MTNRRWWSAAIAVVAVLLIAGPAVAGTFTFNQSDFDSSSKGGGEFKVDDFTGGVRELYEEVTYDDDFTDDGSDFHTFCLERYERYEFGETYYYELSSAAMYNNIDAQTKNPLEEETAKLYYAFWANAWTDSDNYSDPGYSYSADTDDRIQSAADLQQAIWSLEGQNAGVLSDQAKLYKNWAADVTWTELGQSSWTGIGLVRVMNVFSDEEMTFDGRIQDLLVVVPLPAAALMGFSMLGVLGVAARRRRRRA